MGAVILDGKTVSENIRIELRKRVTDLGLTPSLSIIYVGNDPASAVYTRNKVKVGGEVGIRSTLHRFASIDDWKLKQFIQEDLKGEDGIIVQLPLPLGMNQGEILNSIPPYQDVDGLHPLNIGRRIMGDQNAFWPCTPLGCLDLLDHYNLGLEERHAVVVGRSNLVGRPLAALLEMRNATVTLCHSRSKPLSRYTLEADLLIAAIGKPKFIDAGMVREDAIVIDVGMNKDQNGKLCGDVDFDAVRDRCSFITPVPGGVGPMTVTELLRNTVLASERNQSGIRKKIQNS